MEPNLPTPHGSPEAGPQPVGPEIATPKAPERVQGYERHEIHEQKHDAGPGMPPPVQPAIPAIPAMPQPVAPATPTPVSATPTVAGDDDLIEKEWVDMAKKVIAETRQDPYLQEKAVSHLQADYLQKRYGKTVKLPEEG